MDDYKEMYITLFKAVTNTIETLKDAQRKAELIFIEQDDEKEPEKSESKIIQLTDIR